MKARVLGSAAGGGFPQWNCGCDNCRAARAAAAGRPGRPTRSRTQECVAVSNDGDSWFLLNASPEIRAQIESFGPLHPRAPRHSPIAAVVLTNGDLDHCLGLLSLRESYPLRVYATAAVWHGFVEDNVLARTLRRFDGQLTWQELSLGRRSPLLCADGRPSGLSLEPIAAPGKLPLHLEGLREASAGDNIGVVVRDDARGTSLAYVPGSGGPDSGVLSALQSADVCFFDGTFWSSEELPAAGLGDKRAEDMAHWPLGGPEGSLGMLRSLPAKRRILIHINNTNPALIEDSEQARAVADAGVELAYDGMELSL